MSDETSLKRAIRSLLEGQRYGVLCLAGESRAYGALVAFAHDADLSTVYFATPVTTRKFRLLVDAERVAFVIDSRSEQGNELMAVAAATILGAARELTDGTDRDRACSLLEERHKHLHSFLTAPTSALFAIAVERVIHVSRFQEVREWTPTPRR